MREFSLPKRDKCVRERDAEKGLLAAKERGRTRATVAIYICPLFAYIYGWARGKKRKKESLMKSSH